MTTMCDCTSSSYSFSRCPPPPPPASIHIIIPFPAASFDFTRNKPPKSKYKFSLKTSQNPNPSSNPDYRHQFIDELKFKEQQPTETHFEFNDNLMENEEQEEDDLVKIIREDSDMKLDVNNQVIIRKKGKELTKRSNVIAKQVITVQSALSLGFVSQLWVDTNTWMVVIVEVRPNLLSGEQEMFFLEDTRQVGDVVLVEDETVMDKEFKLAGLETLVGYSVVTPGRRDIGKVRGYTFNINSGAIESLELDSFGISIIPSTLVSTYALLVEDVLEVVSDTVVVHDAAASRIQRLTKGFWDAQRTNYSMDDLEERSEFRKGRRKRPGFGNPRPREKTIDNTQEDWDLPMDYL